MKKATTKTILWLCGTKEQRLQARAELDGIRAGLRNNTQAVYIAAKHCGSVEKQIAPYALQQYGVVVEIEKRKGNTNNNGATPANPLSPEHLNPYKVLLRGLSPEKISEVAATVRKLGNVKRDKPRKPMDLLFFLKEVREENFMGTKIPVFLLRN